MTKYTAEQIAAKFGCTAEQVKAQHAKNAKELEGMAEKASRTGRKVNNYTEAQLRQLAEQSRQRSL
jgi:hypothetical protein